MTFTRPLFLLATLIVASRAIRFPLEARSPLPGTGHLARRLGKRSVTASLDGSASVSDVQDFQYTIDVTMAGQKMTLQIDTGSSDLWMATDSTSGLTDTGYTAEVDYVSGSAEGPVATGDFDFGGVTVQNQAFILVTPSDAFPANKGLVGLGPWYGSQIIASVEEPAADPPLDRIFQQESTDDSFITVQLGRFSDGKTAGALTIGEVLSQYQNITSMPQLPVNVLDQDEIQNQHWQTLSDPNGIIGPNGQQIETPSVAATNLNSSAHNQLSYIFDTGFTLPQVPGYVSDAIYSGVDGAQKMNLTSTGGPTWVLPCDAEVNITFLFGGVKYPIHPLDANMEGFTDNNNNDICVGSFQEALPGVQSDAEDGNLGMAFLRNVYMLINFGGMVQGSNSDADPYIQLLPLTDPATAHEEFINDRVNGKGPKAGGAPRASAGVAAWASLVAVAFATFSALL